MDFSNDLDDYEKNVQGILNDGFKMLIDNVNDIFTNFSVWSVDKGIESIHLENFGLAYPKSWDIYFSLIDIYEKSFSSSTHLNSYFLLHRC